MTKERIWNAAAEVLRAKASRLASNAMSGTSDHRAEKFREAETLRKFADIASGGPTAVSSYMNSANASDTDRRLAATEIYGLAQRRESCGSTSNLSASLQAGWERGGDDLGLPIHRATLLESVDLTELALAFQYEDYWAYLRGLQLERLGQYFKAVAVLEALTGQYAKHAPAHIKRCRCKAAGQYDAEAQMINSLDKYANSFKKGSNIHGIMGKLKYTLLAAVRDRLTNESDNTKPSEVEPMDNENLERAAAFAQTFAEHLTDGNFSAAASMLSADVGQSAVDLKEEYEGMTMYDDTPDPGPFEVMVMQCTPDMPDMLPEDQAWAYVSICGQEFNEAVTVVVTRIDEELRIRELEWGRP